MKLPEIKITTNKRTLNKDLIDEFIVEEYKGMIVCENFENGQEFVIAPDLASKPERFYDRAWADFRNNINLIASGGNIRGMNKKERYWLLY